MSQFNNSRDIEESSSTSQSIHLNDRKSDKLTAGQTEITHPVDIENPQPPPQDGKIHDAVWGTIDEDGPNYRNLGWVRASVLELKTQIGLGVLGLPAVLDTLGFVPGVIVIVVLAIIITWSDLVVGYFKLNHPEVYTVADAAHIMFGPWGREIIGFAFWLEVVAIAGASFLSISVAFNTMTEHAACTVVWVVVGAIIVAVFASIQTLGRISWLGWVGLISILSAVVTLMIAAGLTDRPSLAPPGDFEIITQVAATPSFVDAINAISIVVFAYAGTPNFFNIVGEMKDPAQYSKSVVAAQTIITMIYLIVGCVTYHFVGQYIASPALGSAGFTVKKVTYGLALPGLIVGGTLYAHTAAKYVFVRILRKSRHLSKNTPVHYIVWFSVVTFTCGIGFIIAEAIPFFNDLLSLIGALLGTLICILMEAYMWMWDNWRAPNRGSRKWNLMMAMNIIFFAIGTFLMIAGTYAAVVVINDNLNSGDSGSPFSCADNSGN
ncbi:uncharacterized protein I303_108014 [Kwoniella dejecticola CBS 10117]|uniref:Amino acid transporter transmembrane domain-containing protein n=1 Tax=Kwoniella dejecticola CBS 10117 TaxID=1296121 RepID=A0A1A5ZWB0_9TREE|nr:uncharacterized protein I303_08005 [Kwoniella dejecticola CBS 10117]OBR82091.1 hypothetical protein I303_08005 [Kwoniella dejecticola CBS 10117]